MVDGMRLEQLPDVLTVEEAAAVLRLSRGSTYEAVRSGKIEAVKVGRRVLIPRRVLLRLLGEQP